ncbi:hypothetical protein QQZ08_007942 [Neonectria magnoliae]|uniref:Uncharacterized protein n=1 Tax=Neonectria magnoliae TaxID=2732573 RepID=A0ABR1HWP9_9HYPO
MQDLQLLPKGLYPLYKKLLDTALEQNGAGADIIQPDGRKFLCYEAEAKQPDCRWTDCKEECNLDSENQLTWKNGNCSGDNRKKFPRGHYGIELSDSYLYYGTDGEVKAKLVVDTAVTAAFDTGDILIFSANTFDTASTVPSIVTNFKLFGRLKGEATLGVKFESKVKLAEWNIDQTSLSSMRTGNPMFSSLPVILARNPWSWSLSMAFP